MRIRQKLFTGFFIISFLIFGFSFGISYLVQEKTFTIFQEIGGKILPGDIALSRMTTELYRTIILLEQYEQSGDIEIRKEMEKALSSLEVHRTTHELYHYSDELSPEIEYLVQTFSREIARYVLLLQKGSDMDEVYAVRKKIDGLLERFLESLNPEIDLSMSTTYQKINDVRKINNDSQIILLAVGMVILLLALTLSIFISLRFSRPLSALRDAAEQIGEGNLSISLPVKSKDEIGDLARAFNKMSIDLKETQHELDEKHQQLKQHKEHLEELVYIRTEELQKSNMTLQNTIEELNEAQSELIETKKMASLSGIVMGVAHEINTPLGVSVTAASGIQDELNELNKSFQSDDISHNAFEHFLDKTGGLCELLRRNLDSSVKLVNSFKEVDVEQEHYNIDWCTINLYSYINNIVNEMETTLSDYQVSINNRCDKELTLYTSPGALSQIIKTLISNSLNHAFEQDKDGQIVITTHQLGKSIQIEYHDNGKGIEAEHLPQIFEPFFTTRRGHKDSTGLGLSIIYNLITRTMKGQIKVQSRLGEGTNFYIDLPIFSESSESTKYS